MIDRSSCPDRFFVLQRRPLGERDDIVVCLGRDSGRFSAVVKGARAPKSRLAGLLEPPIELEGAVRRGANLDSLSQLQLCRAFAGLRQNLPALLTAGFLGRLFTEALPERSPLEGAYELLGHLLERLALGAEVASAALLAQDRLLMELGVAPEIETCLGCGSPEVKGFSAVDGGLLCAQCYAGSGFSVTSSALSALHALRQVELEQDWPSFAPPVVREVGRIFKEQFQQHLGLPDRVFRPVLPKARPS